MRDGFAGMAVGMDVHRAVAMIVTMKMHAVAPQPPQHMGAETRQHDADGDLDRPREISGMAWPSRIATQAKTNNVRV